MPKIKIFLWQLYDKALPAQGALFRRGLTINLVCPFCLGDSESIECLFKDCPMVQKVREAANKHKWLPLSVSLAGYHDMLHSLDGIYSSHNQTVKQKFSFLVRGIWKETNTTVLKNEAFNPLACLIRSKKSKCTMENPNLHVS